MKFTNPAIFAIFVGILSGLLTIGTWSLASAFFTAPRSWAQAGTAIFVALLVTLGVYFRRHPSNSDL